MDDPCLKRNCKLLNFLNKLTCITCNCEYADHSRIDLIKSLYQQCDFLLLQEHGLYRSQFDWFNSLGDNVGKHGVNAMNGRVLLKGRPRGGAAIIWKGSFKARVTPIDIESQTVCPVSIEYDNIKVLLIFVYMPCDDKRPNQNIIECKSVLNDIITYVMVLMLTMLL